MIVTWDEAFEKEKIPISIKSTESYRSGYRSGWLDCTLNHDSQLARVSTWGYSAMGYVDGRRAYSDYNHVVCELEGEITCLKSLLG